MSLLQRERHAVESVEHREARLQHMSILQCDRVSFETANERDVRLQ